MGKTMLGGATQEGSAELLNPGQQQFLGSALGPTQPTQAEEALRHHFMTPEQLNAERAQPPTQQRPNNAQLAGDAYSQFLQQYDPQQFQDFFQQSFIDPSQQALQRQIIPGLKENFLGLDESGSSALNRALAQSATDLSTNLGQGIMGQYNQFQQNQMGALGQLGGLTGMNTLKPIIHQSEGLLPGIINLVASFMGGGK